MTTWQLLTTTWAGQPSVLAGCALLLAGYAAVARPAGGRSLVFGSAVLVLLLALVSPLDTLGDRYLFSAHMLQHLLLMLIVPPLLLMGLPPWLVGRALRWAPLARAERVLGQPLLAWMLGTATLWLWHVPALYEAALLSPGLHVVQHLSLLVTATIFWWPVVAPGASPDAAGGRARRLTPLVTVPYLIVAGLASSVLGVILTFAPPGLYPFYAHPVGTPALVLLVRQDWGLSYAADQQLGGLLMWVLGGPIYLLAGLGALARWWAEPEEEGAGEEWDLASDAGRGRGGPSAWAACAEGVALRQDDLSPRLTHDAPRAGGER